MQIKSKCYPTLGDKLSALDAVLTVTQGDSPWDSQSGSSDDGALDVANKTRRVLAELVAVLYERKLITPADLQKVLASPDVEVVLAGDEE